MAVNDVGDTYLSNDHLELTPRTEFDGPALEFDFPAMQVGVAEYAEGPTGCTVFHFPKGVSTASDIRGGYPGTAGDYGWNHAICFAGGSLYGLEATAGVSAELFAMRGYATHWGAFALASGAIVYDYGNRKNSIYPDKALGRAALRTARTGIFPLGPRGAGSSVSVGKGSGATKSEKAGQGGAFRHAGPTKIAVFTVVNAIGAIIDRDGKVVRGHLDAATGERRHLFESIERGLPDGEPFEPAPGNTTLTLVATNQKLEPDALRQLGRQAHTSMARAIQPFHTMYDGDVLYAVTTGEIENPALEDTALGVLASELAWDAVLSCYKD